MSNLLNAYGRPTNLEVMNKGRLPSGFTEVGGAGLSSSGGIITEEFLPQLQGQQGMQIYREMIRNDPIVNAMVTAEDMMVQQIAWDVELQSETDEVEKQAKKFLLEVKEDMEGTWSDFISDAFGFLHYGYSMFNVVYKIRKGGSAGSRFNPNKKLQSKYNDGRIGWGKLAFRSQLNTSRWDISPVGDVEAVWHQNNDLQETRIPIEAMLHFKARSAGGNPEGLATLRGAYRPWWFKKRMEETEAIGVERDLAGFPVLSPPENFDWEHSSNTAFVAWAKNVIVNIRRDQYEGLILPSKGWELQLMTSGGARQHDTTEIINRLDKRIAMTTLSQFLMLGMDRTGSFALVRSLNDLWESALDGYVTAFLDRLNKFGAEKLLFLNPPFDKILPMPKFKAGKINAPPLMEIADLINVAAGNQILDFHDAETTNTLRRYAKLPLISNERAQELEQRAVEGREIDNEEFDNAIGGKRRTRDGTEAGDAEDRAARDRPGRGKNNRGSAGRGRDKKPRIRLAERLPK